jgi:hypothetical protein
MSDTTVEMTAEAARRELRIAISRARRVTTKMNKAWGRSDVADTVSLSIAAAEALLRIPVPEQAETDHVTPDGNTSPK